MNVVETFKVLKTKIVEGTDNVAMVYWIRIFKDQETSFEVNATGVTETVAEDDVNLIPLSSITDDDIRNFVMEKEGSGWDYIGDHCMSNLAFKVREDSYVTHGESEEFEGVFGSEAIPVEVM